MTKENATSLEGKNTNESAQVKEALISLGQGLSNLGAKLKESDPSLLSAEQKDEVGSKTKMIVGALLLAGGAAAAHSGYEDVVNFINNPIEISWTGHIIQRPFLDQLGSYLKTVTSIGIGLPAAWAGLRSFVDGLNDWASKE